MARTNTLLLLLSEVSTGAVSLTNRTIEVALIVALSVSLANPRAAAVIKSVLLKSAPRYNLVPRR